MKHGAVETNSTAPETDERPHRKGSLDPLASFGLAGGRFAAYYPWVVPAVAPMGATAESMAAAWHGTLRGEADSKEVRVADNRVPDPPWVYSITTAAYLIRRGIPSDVRRQWGSVFGRLAKRRFMEINDRRVPGTVNRWIRRSTQPVFAYREVDIPMLDEVWDELAKRTGLEG